MKILRGKKWLALLIAVAWGIGAARAAEEGAKGGLIERIKQKRAQSSSGDESELGGLGALAKWNGPYPKGARVWKDVEYGADKLEKMDIYAPAAGAVPSAVIVMVHGGGWRRGDKGYGTGNKEKVFRWLPQGVAVVALNYPLVPQINPAQQAREVAKALARLERDAGKYGLDMGRISLMGHSAGAHLVSLLASNPDWAKEEGYRGSWRAVVSLDTGSMDVEQTMGGKHFGLYDTAFGSDPSLWALANPMRALKADPGPMLLVCSSSRSDSCPQSKAYEKKAIGLGAKGVKTMPVALGHGKINSELGKPGAYTDGVEAFLKSAGVLPATK